MLKSPSHRCYSRSIDNFCKTLYRSDSTAGSLAFSGNTPVFWTLKATCWVVARNTCIIAAEEALLGPLARFGQLSCFPAKLWTSGQLSYPGTMFHTSKPSFLVLVSPFAFFFKLKDNILKLVTHLTDSKKCLQYK